VDAKDFSYLLAEYTEIKEKHVTPRLKFYVDRVENKRRLAQWSRALILLLSLTIPIVVHIDQTTFELLSQNLVVSLMSVLIALAGGLEGLHQWQLTWREYSSRIVQIETLIALWEVQVARARQLSEAKDASEALYAATEHLLLSVEKAVLTEMEGFFSERSKTQQRQAVER
jgi:hypothetical protein